MLIMGLNGWTERGHDAGATIIRDGKLLYSIEEEKLIRKRYAYDTKPLNSIKKCLEFANCSLDDIDEFYIGWDYISLYKMISKPFITKEEMSVELFGSDKYATKIHYVNHHISHAYSSYIPSGFENSIVVVLDGQGEYMGTSVFLANRKEKTLKLLYETPISTGYFYSGITRHIGFHGGEEGKTMGLAAYGKPVYKEELIKHINYQNGKLTCSFLINKKDKDEEEESISKWIQILSNYLPQRKSKITCIDEEAIPYANMAQSAQVLLEETVEQLVEYYVRHTGVRNICLAGGVALNCPLSSRIEKNPFVERVFVQPAANDGGISLGAAIYGSIDCGVYPKIEMIPYLGPEYTDKEILSAILKSDLSYSRVDNIEEEIAKLLLQDNIVAVFQGRLEFGPRSLGNRSILGRPDKKNIFIRMNTLKGRELWRPLAPAVLYEYQQEYFDSCVFSPHMTKSMSVLNNKRSALCAITHIDGTARVQSVTKLYNNTFYKIISSFYECSGIPILINTSFNVKGEPIVCTPQEAIDSFKRMELDYLCIGNYILSSKSKI